MADNAVVHIGENSPEHVAFQLLEKVAYAEGRSFYNRDQTVVDREWILRTYAQCLYAVRNPSYVGDALKADFGQS